MIGRGGERREESTRGDARTSLRSDCNEECTLKHSAWVITWNKGEKPDRREAKSWEVRESHGPCPFPPEAAKRTSGGATLWRTLFD